MFAFVDNDNILDIPESKLLMESYDEENVKVCLPDDFIEGVLKIINKNEKVLDIETVKYLSTIDRLRDNGENVSENDIKYLKLMDEHKSYTSDYKYGKEYDVTFLEFLRQLDEAGEDIVDDYIDIKKIYDLIIPVDDIESSAESCMYYDKNTGEVVLHLISLETDKKSRWKIIENINIGDFINMEENKGDWHHDYSFLTEDGNDAGYMQYDFAKRIINFYGKKRKLKGIVYNVAPRFWKEGAYVPARLSVELRIKIKVSCRKIIPYTGLMYEDDFDKMFQKIQLPKIKHVKEVVKPNAKKPYPLEQTKLIIRKVEKDPVANTLEKDPVANPLEKDAVKSKKRSIEEYEEYFEKNPSIVLKDKCFSFLLKDKKDLIQQVIDNGGQYRTSVSRLTDYLVVEHGTKPYAKLHNAIKLKENSEKIKIVFAEDVEKALAQNLDSSFKESLNNEEESNVEPKKSEIAEHPSENEMEIIELEYSNLDTVYKIAENLKAVKNIMIEKNNIKFRIAYRPKRFFNNMETKLNKLCKEEYLTCDIDSYADFHRGDISFQDLKIVPTEEAVKELINFINICIIYTKENALESLVDVVPKKKDGTFVARRRTYIAYTAVSIGGMIYTLSTSNATSNVLDLEIKALDCRHSNLKKLREVESCESILTAIKDRFSN